MSQVVTLADGTQHRSVIADVAHRYSMEPAPFEATLRATVVPKDCSREQFAAFILVARQYDLNPITKEIYAFPTRGGGIQPIVGIDGWMKLINSHPDFDGMEFEDQFDSGGKLLAITCRMYRKDRSRPVAVTEYLEECQQGTDPWKRWPARMLRHKAAIQAARYAFGFSGIVDPDEYDRLAPGAGVTPPAPPAIAHPTVQQEVSPETAPPAPPKAAPPPPPAPKQKPETPPAHEAFTGPDDCLTGLAEALGDADTPSDAWAIWGRFKGNPAIEFPGDNAKGEQMVMDHVEFLESRS